MKKTINIFLIALMALTTSAQNNYSDKRDVDNFRKISFSVAGDVFVTIGNTFSVTLEGDRSYLDEIETVVSNGTLRIRRENNLNRFFNVFNNEKITVYITMPRIDGLSVSGSGKITVEDPLITENLDSSISGSGKIYLQEVRIEEASCSISGSGNLYMEDKGTISEFDLAISGSGDFDAPEVIIGRLSARISGSGSCDCHVTGELDASISGSGDIYYSGNPRINVRSSGSGKIRSK